MYVLNMVSAIKKTVNELKDFFFENYYQRMGFARENSYYSAKHQKKGLQLLATKLREKIHDSSNAKEYYESFLRKKKLVKRSKIITQQPKPIRTANAINIKSVTIEYLKTSHKLSKTIRPATKVGAPKIRIALFIVTPQNVKIFGTKKCKSNKTISCLKRLCKFL